MKYKNILWVFLLILFSSCDMRGKKIKERYYITTVDVKEDQNISYLLTSGDYIGVIPPLVKEIGIDDKYIYAKQYPVNFNRVELQVENFYLIPLKNEKVDDYNVDEYVLGPFTYKQFKIICDSLKIVPEFKKVY